jgi:hypothetical protein
MSYPNRKVHNPGQIKGTTQQCTWASDVVSESSMTTTLTDDDDLISIKIEETRVDGSHTQRASITLDRSKSIELIKILSALI